MRRDAVAVYVQGDLLKPVFLLRASVMGYGLYLIAKRLLHVEYGFSTLALALWGTLITVLPVTNDTVFQTDLTIKQEKTLKLEVNDKVVPKIGTPVKLVIQVK